MIKPMFIIRGHGRLPGPRLRNLDPLPRVRSEHQPLINHLNGYNKLEEDDNWLKNYVRKHKI